MMKLPVPASHLLRCPARMLLSARVAGVIGNDPMAAQFRLKLPRSSQG
jgi:hypothetical protein